MTTAQKSALRIGLLTTIGGGLVLFAAKELMAQVILRPELEAMAARIEQRLVIIENMQRDFLCTDHPTHWRCK